MDTQIGIWRIDDDNQPIRLQRSQLALEKHLEDWIEADPAMVGHGIIIVGRQVHCEGGFIDLLAVDEYTNQWVIIEIKRGNVRRDTVIQAIDYASSIDMMASDVLRGKIDDYLRKHGKSLQQLLDQNILLDDMFGDRREVRLAVVGTGHDTDLARVVNYLANKHDMSISVVEFDVFEGRNGEVSLIRQLTEQDEPQRRAPTPQQEMDDYQRLFSLAESNGIGEEFRMVYDACIAHGLYARPYKWSIMYTPPEHKGRCLVVAWVKPTNGKLVAYTIPQTFAEYYPIREARAAEILGDGDRQLLDRDETIDFIQRLNTLFEEMDNQEQ